jgi:hypothetical protein
MTQGRDFSLAFASTGGFQNGCAGPGFHEGAGTGPLRRAGPRPKDVGGGCAQPRGFDIVIGGSLCCLSSMMSCQSGPDDAIGQYKAMKSLAL